jgi:hypothetical protein
MTGRENIWARRAGLLGLCALLLAGNVAFFLWHRETAQDRERGLESRRVQLEKDAAAAEGEAERLSAQRDRLSKVSSVITEFYEKRVGPRRETLAPLVEDLHTVLRRVGVNPSQISYTIAPVTDLPLTEMDISFSFRNDYARFKQLLAAFESGRRWIVVRDVGLSRDTEVPGGVQVRMRLATYFAGEDKSHRPRPRAVASRSPVQ